MPEARADAVKDAAGRAQAGVAAAAVLRAAPVDVAGALRHDVHVGRRRVHVGRRPEGAAQRGDQVPVAEEQRPPRVPHGQLRHREHGLAAAEGHSSTAIFRVIPAASRIPSRRPSAGDG